MSAGSAPQLRATTVAIADPGDLMAFLGEADDCCWVRRGEGIVGLGVLARLEVADLAAGASAWAELARHIEHTTEFPGAWGVGPVAFGSFAFDPGHTAARSVLVVPRVIVGRRGERAWLTVISDRGEPVVALPERSASVGDPGRVGVTPAGVDADAWADLVAELVTDINAPGAELAKVVLARAVVATAERPIEPAWLAGRLAASYPSCWTFHVEGLVGASPEMLIRVEGGLATSRVLAGTIRRSEAAQDEALAEALSGSGKDLAEHRFAVDSVAEKLRGLCTGMNVPDAPFVLQLPNVMHLASDVTGVMAAHTSSLELAGRLHPSAAVCGTPTDAARLAIAEREGLDRGRYAGPVGWIDLAGDGEWAIALRCGQIDPDAPQRITLYAGCGIVGASKPEAEVAETRAKLRPMLDALGAVDA